MKFAIIILIVWCLTHITVLQMWINLHNIIFRWIMIVEFHKVEWNVPQIQFLNIPHLSLKSLSFFFVNCFYANFKRQWVFCINLFLEMDFIIYLITLEDNISIRLKFYNFLIARSKTQMCQIQNGLLLEIKENILNGSLGEILHGFY